MDVSWVKVDKDVFVELNTSSETSKLYWVYTKSKKIYIAKHEWRQGWYPDIFQSIDGITIAGNEVVAIADFKTPTPPIFEQ